MSVTEFEKLLNMARCSAIDPRTLKDLRQEGLADLVGSKLGTPLSPQTVSHWENGRNVPGRVTLVAVVKVLKECGGLGTVELANALLESAGKARLNDKEVAEIYPPPPPSSPLPPQPIEPQPVVEGVGLPNSGPTILLPFEGVGISPAVKWKDVLSTRTAIVVGLLLALVVIVIVTLRVIRTPVGQYESVPRTSISRSAGLSSTAFDLPEEPKPIRLSSLSNSYPNYPRLTYPMSGDFEAMVAVSINAGDTQPRYNVSVTGLGIYSERLNNTVLLSRVFYRENQSKPVDEFVQGSIEGVGAMGNSHECKADTGIVYLKIRKVGKLITTSCRTNDATDWIEIEENYSVDFGDNFQLFLFAYSTNDTPITAYFSDFEVLRIPD